MGALLHSHTAQETTSKKKKENDILTHIHSLPIDCLASVNVSVGKKDGTLNTTIVDLKGLSTLRVIQSWNVTAATFTPGDYLVS